MPHILWGKNSYYSSVFVSTSGRSGVGVVSPSDGLVLSVCLVLSVGFVLDVSSAGFVLSVGFVLSDGLVPSVGFVLSVGFSSGALWILQYSVGAEF